MSGYLTYWPASPRCVAGSRPVRDPVLKYTVADTPGKHQELNSALHGHVKTDIHRNKGKLGVDDFHQTFKELTPVFPELFQNK